MDDHCFLTVKRENCVSERNQFWGERERERFIREREKIPRGIEERRWEEEEERVRVR